MGLAASAIPKSRREEILAFWAAWRKARRLRQEARSSTSSRLKDHALVPDERETRKLLKVHWPHSSVTKIAARMMME